MGGGSWPSDLQLEAEERFALDSQFPEQLDGTETEFAGSNGISVNEATPDSQGDRPAIRMENTSYLSWDYSLQRSFGVANISPSAIQLVDLASDRQDLSFVEKVRVLKSNVIELCSLLSPTSVRETGKGINIASKNFIDFEDLSSHSINVVGLYGDKKSLIRVIREWSLDPLLVDQMESGSLKTGLFACLGSSHDLCLIYWDAREKVVESSRKDMTCNFVRYLIDLCNTVFVCLDGRMMESYVSSQGVDTLDENKDRIQRLRISRSKELGTDLKLFDGFNIENGSCDSHSYVRLAQGLHRCVVLDRKLKEPKLYLVEDSISGTPTVLRDWVNAKLEEFSFDCTRLPDAQVLELFEVLEKQAELQRYTETRKVFKQREADASQKHSSLGTRMRDLEDSLVFVGYEAVEILFKHESPWGWNLVNEHTGRSIAQQVCADRDSAKGSTHDMSALNPLLRFEAMVCSAFSGNDSLCQRLLFPGSQFEVSDADRFKTGQTCSTGARIWTLIRLKGSVDEVHGPLCYGQQFVFTIMGSEVEGSGPLTGSFSLVEESTLQMGDPVILDGYTRVKFEDAAKRKIAPRYVMLKYYDGVDLRCKAWLKATCKIEPKCLHRNASALSYLTSRVDLPRPRERVLKTLLMEPIEEWASKTKIPQVASMLEEFLAGQCDTNDVIDEAIVNLCVSIYKTHLNLWKKAVCVLVREKICPCIRNSRSKQSREEIEMIRKECHSQLETMLSEIKSKVLCEPEGNRNKLKLTLHKLETAPKSLFHTFKTALGCTNEFKLSYSYEQVETHTVSWLVTEFVPKQADIDVLRCSSSPTQALSPMSRPPLELISLDPNASQLCDVVLLKGGQVLVLVEAVGEACLHLYCYPRLGYHVSKNPIRSFKRGHDLWAFDEALRTLALYDKNSCCIHFFRFDERYEGIDRVGDVQLAHYAGTKNITWIGLIPGKREILLVDDENRLRMCNFASRMMRPRHAVLPTQLIKACITPDALCFVAIYSLRETGNGGDKINENGTNSISENMSISIYLLDDSFTLLKCLSLKSMIGGNVTDFHAECKFFGPQLHLVFLFPGVHSYTLTSQVMQVTSTQQKCQIRAIDAHTEASLEACDKTHGVPGNGSLVALNYIFHAFDKYAISPPLCPEHRNLSLRFLLCPPRHDWEDDVAKGSCESLVKSLIRNLEGKGKIFEGLNLEVSFKSLRGNRPFEEGFSAQQQSIARWLKKLLCLVPVQIARAENNMLRLMIDGLEIPSNVEFSDAVSLANILHFGTYDLLLESWKGKIKVVSSMGKQSSGKSYLLNHLAGSLLDVAGGRCTDGVWMTVRWDSECMYVLLDFEGLGSFERNEQEDMLLSTLSAAISNVTIFNKKDFHMDKETEAIFQRFQHGVTLVKDDDKLFKGEFFIAVKDVDSADVEDLKVEFHEKIQTMCNRTSENFFLRMYDGQVCILAFPPFQRHEYKRGIETLASGIRETATQYKNGRCFLQDFKLVLSQISAQDWSSVESRRIIMRISTLRTHLQSAITLGHCNDGEMLANLDNDDDIKDDPMYSESGIHGSIQLQDSGLKLAVNQTGDEISGMDDIVESLRLKFQAAFPRVDHSEKAWHAAYQRFLSSLMDRRQNRVLEWLRINTKEFREDGDIQQLVLEVTTRLVELKNKVLLCSCKCSKCFLTCVLLKGHYSDHSCLGTHICSQECSFCQEEQIMYFNAETAPIIMECTDVAGHSGRHDCNKRMHTCQKNCIQYERASNCNKKCSLRANHLGEHYCNSQRHMCKEKCSLPGCENACVMAFDSEHERHVCHEQFCSVQCSMPGCMRQCATKNHFHELEADAQHFCSNKHPCAGMCEVPGVCNVVTELLKQTKRFHGQRGNFEYDFVSEQSEDRKGCCLMIPAFTRKHSGPHVHSTNTNVVHYCDKRCPDCDYYCQLPFGHAGSHNTVHGNMKKTKFVAEMEDIDLQDRKYVRGESGVAEMCAMHCRARGRGHTHLIPCPEVEGNGCCTGKLYDGARHLSKGKCQLLGVKTPLDEMTHDTYWEYISFVDPCEEDEREVFSLCNHVCLSEEHDSGTTTEKSYCTEKLWHDPVPKATSAHSGSGGYVTEDGHHFTCDHAKIAPHNVIFVMDKSGSMSSRDIVPTMAMFQSDRLGCVFEAVLRFIRMRMQATTSSGFHVEDTVSVVLFDTVGQLCVHTKPISESVVHNLLHYQAAGGTTYSSGLEVAGRILGESRGNPQLDGKAPVIIFLSDGGNNGGTDPVYEVHKMRMKDPRLVLHTIMFGTDLAGKILKDMANAGNGTYQLSLDEVQLARSFEDLAKSLQPKLVALCNC